MKISNYSRGLYLEYMQWLSEDHCLGPEESIADMIWYISTGIIYLFKF